MRRTASWTPRRSSSRTCTPSPPSPPPITSRPLPRACRSWPTLHRLGCRQRPSGSRVIGTSFAGCRSIECSFRRREDAKWIRIGRCDLTYLCRSLSISQIPVYEHSGWGGRASRLPTCISWVGRRVAIGIPFLPQPVPPSRPCTVPIVTDTLRGSAATAKTTFAVWPREMRTWGRCRASRTSRTVSLTASPTTKTPMLRGGGRTCRRCGSCSPPLWWPHRP
mmetsp:Transcript_14133/g.19331  ORF Transcript_14133/g.19331 Transcript_14133/m.19331 type:complete len:221 (-) Transcript_14133:1880-2542(-)